MKGPPLPNPKFQTVVQALAASAESNEGLIFVDLHEQETTLPWRDVYNRSRTISASLIALGVKPADRVVLILPTGPDFIHVFFALLLAGATPVPVYPPLRLGRLQDYHIATARMISLVSARLVLTDTRIRRLLGKTIEASRPPLGCLTVDDLRMVDSGYPLCEIRTDALALIQFSSGSTVEPKPVALSHRNLIAQCESLYAIMKSSTGENQRGVSWLPLYHDMGLIGCLLSAVYYPGTMVLLAPEHFLARPALWLRAIGKYRGTISPAPNFAYSLCLKKIKDSDLEGVDLSSWRFALNGAEPISAHGMHQFAERFARFGLRPEALTPVYGLSEASLAVTFSSVNDPVKSLCVDPLGLATTGKVTPGTRDIVSVGKPLFGMEIEIRDDSGHVLPERQVGHIYASGPSIMEGYWQNPEATSKAIQAGWLDTGDLGFLADGELYVCGRAKDIVIIRGANHQPQEFEECLDTVEGVRTGCAVALGFCPTSEESEALLILAERAGPPDASLQDRIRTTILERTGVLPHTVCVLEPGTLPRTSSGKMRRAEALRQFNTGALTAPKKVHTLGIAIEAVRSAVSFAKVRATEPR